MIFDEPVAGPPDRTRPVPVGRSPIVEWQVVYLGSGGQVVRDMAIRKGALPPLKTQWDGMIYTREFYNEPRLSVTYARYREDQR
jgi:hypothetical protein